LCEFDQAAARAMGGGRVVAAARLNEIIRSSTVVQ